MYRPWAWLIPIVLLQAGLALRTSGPIATDEATYIVAGHQIIANVSHGTPVQQYGSYFSGLPGLYPVIAAAIDHVGGITAVRLLSLLCMIGVNLCLFRITTRLFGLRTGLVASFVFATTSGATFLAWYSTFDAMSLVLLAVAFLLVVDRANPASAPWRAVPVGILLATAVAVKYVAILFVPSILIVLFLLTLQRSALRHAIVQTAVALMALAATALLFVAVAAPSDRTGFMLTSTAGRRVIQSESRLHLLQMSWSFIGPWLLLALAGLVAVHIDRRRCLLSIVLFGTSLLPLASQITLGELVSLHKHTAFGFFFAAPLAGYAITWALAYGRARVEMKGLEGTIRTDRRGLVPAAAVLWLVVLLGAGMSAAGQMQYGWPVADRAATAIEPYVNKTGHYLADNPSIPSYLFSARSRPEQWSAPWFFERVRNHQVLRGDAALLDAINHKFFTAIIYRPPTFTKKQRQLLLPAIEMHYRLASQVFYQPGQAWSVWVPST
jgi:4-amino-4-deoxy-L-arabinose transferase-like glycosyltransferase